MDLGLRGKTALVCAASKGLGRGCAISLAREGVRLVITARGKEAKGSKKKAGGNLASAKEIGKQIAQRAQEKGIKKVVFDRGGYLYHGRIKALADAAREAGLEF